LKDLTRVEQQASLPKAAVPRYPGKSGRLLAGGLLASVLASVCCLGPFFLLATGLSAAWMGRVMALEPLQPVFTLVAVALTVAAGWQLFSSRKSTDRDAVCELRSAGRLQRITWFSAVAVITVLLTSVYWIELVA